MSSKKHYENAEICVKTLSNEDIMDGSDVDIDVSHLFDSQNESK